MIWALGIVVPIKMYDRFGAWGYLGVGLAAAVPCVALPLLIPGTADSTLPLTSRFWFKASAYIATFSFIGNWFWTHYFYELLGAAYTMPPTHDWNRVPVCMYLLTHAYFCFYHALGNVAQRGARRAALRAGLGRTGARVAQALVVFCLSYATAWGETATIAHFPHYRFTDRARMYRVGSLFYALYFFVSFPWFLSLDEEDGHEGGGGAPSKAVPKVAAGKCTAGSATAAALAAGMAVTLLLDLWRVFFGGIAPAGGGGRWVAGERGAASRVVGRWARLPWMVGGTGC
jgi:cycloeucalenol cycloisomerase